MTLYIRRKSSKLWKRFCSETTTEISLLAENWKYLLAGLICQYIHGLTAKGVHYIHRAGPTLQDLVYSLEDGPVHHIWQKIGVPVTILEANHSSRCFF